MNKADAGRVWYAVTALVVAVGIVVQLFVTAGSSDGYFPDNPDRVFNVFAYFTIQSNLLLGGTCLLLALDPERWQTLLFRTLRLNGVVCIAVTGIVYHLVLAGTDTLTGAGAFANLLVHTATPLLGVLGWLIFGPRGQTVVAGRRVVDRVPAALAGLHADPRRGRPGSIRIRSWTSRSTATGGCC